MTEVEYVRATYYNAQIKYLKRDKVAAVSLASGGAMVMPGEIVIFFAGDDCIVEARNNYVYGDFDVEALDKQLRLSQRGAKAWAEYYLGAGNTLLINARDYPMLNETLKGKDTDLIGAIYRDEIWIALSCVNDIMSGLRQKIIAEQTQPGFAHMPRKHDEELEADYGLSITVTLVMGEGQPGQENCPPGLRSDFPDCRRIYLKEMDATPDEICLEKETGWAKKICVRKSDFPELISLCYSDGTGDWDWKGLLDLIDGDVVCIHGYGD